MDRDLAYDFFVSYASADNRGGWVTAFVEALLTEFRARTGGRELVPWIDAERIENLAHWRTEIFNKGLVKSRFFVAFLSPNYFASEVCRREWKAWIDQEISLHVLEQGSAPVYFVEVPGFLSKPPMAERDVAREVEKLCGLARCDRFAADLSPVVKEARRRHLTHCVQPFQNAGVRALEQEDLRAKLAKLAAEIEQRSEEARKADESENTVPPYNAKFTGRLDELLELRALLCDNRAGVVAGVHGLGGIGKTELAYTFAWAYGGVYPGGRFEVRCENRGSLQEAVNIGLGSAAQFHPHITDEERKEPATLFAAVKRCLKNRLDAYGPVLLVLDNVSKAKLLTRQETDLLTALGPQLHLLATTRLASLDERVTGVKCLILGEMKPADAVALLDKFRPFADDADREAAESIVRQLGGFALAVELFAAKLAATPSATYAAVADGLGLADLDELAEDGSVESRRHNHEKRLRVVLGQTLALLSPEELRAIEYAALLPPDNVPLPWLRPLLIAEYPALATAGKWGDPWLVLVDRLVRLGLFTRVQEVTTSTRQVRVHRLVQELVRTGLSCVGRLIMQGKIEALMEARGVALEKETLWAEAAWEIEPLKTLAKLWEDYKPSTARYLSVQVSIRLFRIAAYSQSEPHIRRALETAESSYGSDHPNVAARLNVLALLLMRTNRFVEAEPLSRRALAIDEASYLPYHPDIARDLSVLALLLHATDRHAEAEPLMRRAAVIIGASYGPDHALFATQLSNLTQLLLATDRHAEAEPLIRRALDIDESSYGPDHPDVGRDLNNLSALLHATNRFAEAEPLMRRALVIDEASYGPRHPAVATRLINLAVLLEDTGRHAEAEPLMQRGLVSYALFKLRTTHNHPDQIAATRAVTAILNKLGRTPQQIEQAFAEIAAEAQALAQQP